MVTFARRSCLIVELIVQLHSFVESDRDFFTVEIRFD